MSEPDNTNALAGEYVLGTLDATERAEVESRRPHEPLLDAAILAWENRLAPLDAATPDVDPSPSIWSHILARLQSTRASLEDSSLADLASRLNRWRAAALTSAALAASLAVAFIWRETARPSLSQNFVAVLQDEGTVAPYFIVEMDLDKHVMTVHPIGAGRQPGKSYELWLKTGREAEPKSLGVVADQGFTIKPTLAAYDRAAFENSIYAITLEPAGGAPNGKPSGPPLWTGKLFQATP